MFYLVFVCLFFNVCPFTLSHMSLPSLDISRLYLVLNFYVNIKFKNYLNPFNRHLESICSVQGKHCVRFFVGYINE